jgi:general stress protein 26
MTERRHIVLNNPERVIGEMIDELDLCLVGSVDADGYPNVKAMLAPRMRLGIRAFWLSTNTPSRRVAQFRENPRACLYFLNERAYAGVQLVGTMEVLTDAASKQLIWRDGDERYNAGGVTDPNYCVLRFTATHGRYYRDFVSEDFTVSA